MDEMMVLGGLLMVSFVVAVGVLLWRSQPSVHPRTDLDHAFARAAAVHPTLTATFENAMQAPSLQGTAHGLSVSSRQLMVEDSRYSSLSSGGRGRVDYVTELHLAGGGALAGGVVGSGRGVSGGSSLPRVRTGDAAFDRAVFVAGTDPLSMLAQLDATRRRALVMARGWRLQHGSWRWELSSTSDHESVVGVLKDGATLVEAARSQVPTVEGLRALVDDDPLPEVREAVLQTWLEGGEPPQADLRRWAAGTDGRALLAAAALGEAGVPYLVALLDHPDVASAAAVHLVRHPDEGHGAHCAEVLLEALASASVQADVVEALGRVGGPGCVAPLRAVGGALRGEASQAIDRIQRRIVAEGGAAGAVSIADAGGGGVALAPHIPGTQRE